MTRLGIMLRRVGIIGTLVCWFSSSVGADPIRSSFRFLDGQISAETTDGSFGIFVKDDGTDLPGLFNRVLTDEIGTDFGLPTTIASYAATQHTDVSATRWSGTGTASTFTLLGDPSFGGTASTESGMTIDFTLVKPMSYLLTGTLAGEGGFAAISLDGPPGLGWVFESGNAVPLVAMRRGLLSAGDYHFEARAFSNASGTGRSVFDMDFRLASPVPEPATLVLFGTGAAFLGRTARRRRREQSVPVGSAPVEEA